MTTMIETRETCDRCGPFVVASWEITLPSGRRLTFCRHCIGGETMQAALPNSATVRPLRTEE